MEPTFCEKKWLIEDTNQVIIRHCAGCESVHVRIGSTTLSFSAGAFAELAGVFSSAAQKVLGEGTRARLPLVAAAATKTRQ